ncbi:MAG: aminoacyl-histidine dipeptidase [Bacteroidales bacterium]
MSYLFENLKPELLWKYFYEILQVPRPSKKEEKIIEYLVDFAESQKLDYQQDKIGNVVIRKPATKGYEHFPIVVLQSHMDMVCEKNSDVEHDFETDPIIPRIEDGWVKASGTTLGGDDGIGVATQLAILASDDIEHGPLEMLFTVDEETGLTGAKELDKDMIKGRILLNLDSEDEGELFIGCAGGRDTRAFLDYKLEDIDKAKYKAYNINVSGLIGGHSGDDINKNRGNAVKILVRLLWLFQEKFGMRLSTFEGGNLRNAIAREASAKIAIPVSKKAKFLKFFDEYSAQILAEFNLNEPDLKITCLVDNKVGKVISKKQQKRLINSVYACPHGVIAMSASIPNFVETSTNLASVKMHKKYFEIGTSQRSSVESSKEYVVNMVESLFDLAGCEVVHDDGYPGWTPNPDSHVMEVTKKAYIRLFGKEPKVLAIHAGLECGLIGEKFPGMDMISFGPTIKGAHSPDERLEIETVEMFWDLTLEVLRTIA